MIQLTNYGSHQLVWLQDGEIAQPSSGSGSTLGVAKVKYLNVTPIFKIMMTMMMMMMIFYYYY